MTKRHLFPLAAAALALVALAPSRPQADEKTIKVGILHSLSGTMAISETALKDVALMTIEEINAQGGVMGKKLVPVVVDPASNWPLFAEKARQLLTQEQVAAVFGCWTSVSRKSVLPVFKELNGILFYPVQYEGEELEKNVFYTGAAPNQQAIPAVEYLMSEDGGGAKRFFLLGTDYVYPRTTNKILRAFLHSKGVKDEDIAEVYTPFGHADYQTIVADIKKFAAGGKTAVVSTINGDSNVPFYKELGNAGLKATDVPVVAFSVGEEELRGIDAKPLVGPPGRLELLHVAQEPGQRRLREEVPRLRQEEGPRQRRHGGHQRPHGGHLRRHPHVEAGGGEGQDHRPGEGDRGGGRAEGGGPLRLHAGDGPHQPPPPQAGLHRRGPRRRSVQRGVEDQGAHPRPALEPVRGGERGQAVDVTPVRLPLSPSRGEGGSTPEDHELPLPWERGRGSGMGRRALGTRHDLQ